MRTVEIKTTQNVVIEYELAGAGSRFTAFLIDRFILIGFGILTGFIMAYVGGLGLSSLAKLFIMFIVIVYCFYTLIFEILMKGQTPGKMALGLRIIRTDGGELTFREYFTRWALRFVDIFLSLGTLAVLTINGSPLGQRIGDMAAGTTVIKIRGVRGFSLRQILSLGNKESYNPVYAGVRNLKEDDVLLIKNTLNRFGKYKSEAYREIIQKLFDKILPFLDPNTLPQKPSLPQKIKILRQVVSDYIVLTR